MLDISADVVSERIGEDGYTILDVSPLVQDSLTDASDAAHHFFGETLEVKKKDSHPKDMGYRPFGREYSSSPSYPDQVESFSVAPGMIVADEMQSESASLLCEKMLTCFSYLEAIAEELAIRLAKSFSQNAMGEQLRGEFHRWSRLQVNYSRPSDVDAIFIK